jgi:hypothetical protein
MGVARVIVIAFVVLAATAPAITSVAPAKRSRVAVAKCSTRSEANFPGAYSDPDNLIVGPLAMVGAAFTDERTVREVGGNKFPALVKNGHRVKIALSRRTRRFAGLAYGPLPQGKIHLRDAHRVVKFVACRRDQDSGSTAGGWPVTFWSGGIVVKSPHCVPLRVWVDAEAAPRRAVVPMGVEDCGP